MKKASSWLWGLVLVALGVILGINALGIARIDIFFPGWWTLFIIVPCAIALFTDEHKGGATAGLVIGICLLLSCLGLLPFSMLWKLLLPALLVIVGFVVIAHGSSNGEVQEKIRKARAEQAEERKKTRHVVEGEVVAESKKSEKKDDDDKDDEEVEFEEYWSTFGDQNINYHDKAFGGCRIDAVFGGADLDLRRAKIKDKAIVRTSSVFGGIIIYVPEDVKVEVASTAIFGGVTDKRKNAKNKKDDEAKKAENAGKTLYIEATCVFGGVEIR